MPNSKALFIVPEDSSNLADIIEEHGGYLEFERDLDSVGDYLSQRAGEVLPRFSAPVTPTRSAAGETDTKDTLSTI
jgi:hypothetical protein